MSDEIGSADWDGLVHRFLADMFRTHRVDLVVVDAEKLWGGLSRLLDKRPDLTRILIQPDRALRERSSADAFGSVFNHVIRLREAGTTLPASNGRIVGVDPILLESREDARAARIRLGLPECGTAVHLKLGLAASDRNRALCDDVVAALATAPLQTQLVVSGVRPPDGRATHGLIRYACGPVPLRAFDFAIAPADYDAAHELLAAGVPAILILDECSPAASEQRDRADRLARLGAAIAVPLGRDRGAFSLSLARAVTEITHVGRGAAMATRARALLPATGTYAAAAFVARVRPRERPSNGATAVAVASSPLVRNLDALQRLAAGDEPELALVPRLLRPGMIAVDVGGDIGLYTLRMVEAGASVTVIECRPDAAAQLERLFSGRDVKVHVLAASDRSGEATLFLPAMEGRLLGSRASLEEAANGTIRQLPHRVSTCRLDDLDLVDVALVKIDVEGHEAAVLRGAATLLAADRPVILMEVEERHHPGQSDQIFVDLDAIGYRPWYLHRGVLSSAANFDFARFQRPDQAKTASGGRNPDYVNNFLFLPKIREAALLADLSGAVQVTSC